MPSGLPGTPTSQTVPQDLDLLNTLQSLGRQHKSGLTHFFEQAPWVEYIVHKVELECRIKIKLLPQFNEITTYVILYA
jgi:hypothetical protein